MKVYTSVRGNLPMRWLVLSGLVVSLLVFSGDVMAAKTKTFSLCQKAQKALAKGDVVGWGRALQAAQRAFEKEKDTMSLFQRYNQELWLKLLAFKYHQIRGEELVIKNIEGFRKKSELQGYIKKVDESIEHMGKALISLKRYHWLFTRVVIESKKGNLVWMRNVLPLDIERSQRDAKIYRSLLLYASKHWSDRSKVRSQLQKRRGDVSGLREALAKRKVDAKVQQQRQKNIAKALFDAQTLYDKQQKDQKGRIALGNGLFWIGVGLCAVGIGGGIFGAYLWNDAEAKRVTIPHAERESLINWGVRFVTIGVVVLAAGVGGVVTGLLIKPTVLDRARGVLKAQELYLDAERKNLPSGQILYHN